MKKTLIYASLFLFVILSCKKQEKLPEPEINDPHFFVKCQMDGQALDMEAGDNDYYMNSSWYHEDSDSVFVYKANLAKEVEKGYQVTILINDVKPANAAESMNPDAALSPGPHLYNDQNASGITQKIEFEPSKPEMPSSSYFWSVNDGDKITTYGGPGPDSRYTISDVFTVGKTYSVTYNYDDNVGVCGASLTNFFKAGSDLQATVTSSRDTSSPELRYTLSYTLLKPNPNVECEWTFPDATVDMTKNPTRTFSPDRHLIKLKLTDKVTGETCLSNYQLSASYSGNMCNANFKAQFSPIYNDRLYSSITVLLTTPDGVVYSSKNLVQPEESNFEIISVDNYKLNEKGQATKSINLRFNCVVKNGSSEIILKDGTARVAVAYK